MKISDSHLLLQARNSKQTTQAAWQADTVVGAPVILPPLLSFQDLLTNRLNPSQAPGFPPLTSGSGTDNGNIDNTYGDFNIQAARLEEMLNVIHNRVLLQTRSILPDQNNEPFFDMGKKSYQTSLFDYHFFLRHSRGTLTVQQNWPTTFHFNTQNTPRYRLPPMQVGNFSNTSNLNSGSINRPTLRRDTWQMTREDQQLQFGASGEVKTEDGRRISFELDQSYTQSITELTRSSSTISPFPLLDPLVLDLDGQGIGFQEDQSFDFDLNGDGSLEQLACLGAGCGFLAYDQNQDGSINNGLELFGTQTGSGFAELAEYDLDGNYWIDENDAIFKDLSIWNHDEQGNEVMQSLLDAEVGAISLAKADSSFGVASDSGELQGQINGSGIYLTEDGEVQAIHQVDLADKGGGQGQENREESQESEKTMMTTEEQQNGEEYQQPDQSAITAEA